MASSERLSRHPRPRSALRCAFFAGLLRASARYGDDPEHEHRPEPTKCPKFECPAFRRPLQQDEDKYQIWIWNRCANHGRKNFQAMSASEEDRVRFRQLLSPCCSTTYICAQTCGMPMEECFERYWNCAENICRKARYDPKKNPARDPNKDGPPERTADQPCIQLAIANDVRYITEESGEVESRHDWSKLPCEQYERFQRKACKCVPADDYDTRVKERFEDFYRLHDPDKLDAAGHFKNISAFKKFKGRRAQMFFGMHAKHARKVVAYRNQTENRVPKDVNNSDIFRKEMGMGEL